jgi:hypothetical protein
VKKRLVLSAFSSLALLAGVAFAQTFTRSSAAK